MHQCWIVHRDPIFRKVFDDNDLMMFSFGIFHMHFMDGSIKNEPSSAAQRWLLFQVKIKSYRGFRHGLGLGRELHHLELNFTRVT